MKRKRPEIPDFARHRPHDQPVNKIGAPKAKPVSRSAPAIKPPATSAKSGRRGQ